MTNHKQMIKFFRKIRQKMLSENKFSKYLIYAIGEIILVVIGILIAISINNWNQLKANQNLEIKILNELSQNLKVDLEEIKFDISLMDSTRSSYNQIIKDLKLVTFPTEKFYNNLSWLKVVPHFDPNKSGYEFLKTKGVDVIKNDSLRTTISNHYELNYPYYNKYEKERVEFKIHQVNPYLIEYFKWLDHPDYSITGVFEITNQDYLKVRNNGSLEKVVMASAWENDLMNSRARRLAKQIEDIIGFINEELETKK
ncbi:DUF6090 family protein [Winogradskyella aquimaris]|uniref:DUF6090 family protein n=1 Tax=Winogradskyella aquimaris TaxID=864074 RepID=A0ABU5ENC2_9FLAO|nr:DUF6090 family protein [Winogradskyella aquimaris]MDY2587569.1 DUF6090 family protein [Winogradskyella aquimaris]